MRKYSDRIKIETENDRSFVIWMDKIENIIQKKLGLNLDDIPDEPYRTCFDYGTTSSEMANKIKFNFENFFL
jgi:hypothetical protein